MFAILATAAISATAAYAQTSSPDAIAVQSLMQLSSECRSAVLSLATSPLTQCLNLAGLAPAISSNASIVPVLDDWMTSICSSDPCPQDVLDSAAQNFSSACAQDVESYGVDAADIEGVFGLYPLVRELVCLKTIEPFTADNSTSNSTTSSNSTSSNSTGSDASDDESAFCVTSLLDELSSYLGTNLTVNGVFALALGSDKEGLQALKEIPPTALCQDCIYSAAGLIEQQYPGISAQPLVNGNFTVGGYLNETCSNETFPVIDTQNNTITLPESVFPAAENSTYPYGIEYFNGTYTPSEDVQQPPALPFANAPAAELSNSTDTASEPSASASSAAVSAPAVTASGAPSVAASSAASEATAAPVQQRDVTAAKRRWVGQI